MPLIWAKNCLDRRRCGLSLIDKFDFDFPVSMNFIQFEGLWMAESSVEVILALNRCLFFAAPGIARFLFGSTDLGTAYRTWLWMIPVLHCYLNYANRSSE